MVGQPKWGDRAKSASRFIKDLLEFIAAVIAILALIGGAIVTFFSRQENLIAGFIGFATGALLLAFIAVAIYVISVSSTSTKWLLRGYQLLSAEYVYEIHDNQAIHYSQTTTIRLKALRYGVEILEQRYNWTGIGEEGKPQIISQDSRNKFIGFVETSPSANDWRYFYIHFGHRLVAGEKTEVKVVQHFYDYQHHSTRRLSKTITEPLDELVLCVKMPRGLFPTNIRFTEYSSNQTDAETIKEEKQQFNAESQEICWKLTKLKRRHAYVITWDYLSQTGTVTQVSQVSPHPQPHQEPPQHPPVPQ